ncbi:MAG: hypothetical protein AAB373_05245 [Patescibacteria group bacterium]
MNQIVDQIGEALTPGENKDGDKKAGKFNLFKAFSGAREELKKNEKKGVFERWGLAISRFWHDLRGIEDAKKDVTDKTAATGGEVINASLDDFRNAFALTEDTKDEDKKSFDVVLASTKASLEDLDPAHQGYAKSAMDKFNKIRAGEEVDGTSVDEMTSFTAVGLGTLKRLKETYPDKDTFKTELTRLYSISEKSKFPLEEVFGEKLLGLFKIKDDDEGLKLLGMFGISGSAGDIIPLAEGDAEEAQRNLRALGEDDFDGDKKDSTVAFLGEHIFPATYAKNKSNVEDLATKINLLATGKIKKVEAGMLADMIFLIEAADMDKLIKVFSGKEAK